MKHLPHNSFHVLIPSKKDAMLLHCLQILQCLRDKSTYNKIKKLNNQNQDHKQLKRDVHRKGKLGCQKNNYLSLLFQHK